MSSRHDVRFPNESEAYRTARDTLLEAEIALRSSIERVAAMRRSLPPGGEVPEDYVFDDGDGKSVRMSELFAPGQDTLVLYAFMYGPKMARPCPMCASLLDGLNANARQIRERVSFAVAAKSPIARIREFATARGWNDLRLLSSAENTYHRDYRGEDEKGAQLPSMNVFVRRDGRIHHSWNSEMLFATQAAGQDARHVDMLWPLWNVFDLTPDGRGTNWYPSL